MSIPEILSRLDREYPDPQCALTHSNAYELIASVILSAQCTDKMVNTITPGLFARFPTVEALANADVAEVEVLVKSSGFYRNKARHLVGMAQMVVGDFNGTIPETLEELMRLPGVARKTANVVLNVWYGQLSGVVVDTHVGRITRLLGVTSEKNPDKVADDLESKIPRSHWERFSLQLIEHGRHVCIARRPDCGVCMLNDLCPSAKV